MSTDMDPNTMDSAQLANAIADGTVDLSALDIAALSPDQLEELERQGIIPEPGDAGDSDDSVSVSTESSHTTSTKDKLDASAASDEDDSLDDDSDVEREAASVEQREQMEIQHQQAIVDEPERDAPADFQKELDTEPDAGNASSTPFADVSQGLAKASIALNLSSDGTAALSEIADAASRAIGRGEDPNVIGEAARLLNSAWHANGSPQLGPDSNLAAPAV